MSRLDSVIRRLEAQRTELNWVMSEISTRPGFILEIGLGNGRTYDHLRSRLKHRDIYVFDRHINAHPACIPPSDHFFQGDIRDTLELAKKQLGEETTILAHMDIGTGDENANKALVKEIIPPLAALIQRGGYLITDQPVDFQELESVPTQPGTDCGRYFLFRRI